MKKWFYVLFPSALLALFVVFYLSSREETLQREREHAAQVARDKADADAKKQIAEQKAHEDADKRAAERKAEDDKAAADKEAKYAADMAHIKAETDKANAEGDVYAKKVSELSIELDTLRKQRDELTEQSFNLEKQVDLKQIERRNAELEIQRYTEMLANRADGSIMAKMPIMPVAPPEKS
jgi:hypothetical protein